MKLYMLAYEDSRLEGASEQWDVFYTPIEAYSTPDLRKKRKSELKAERDPDDGTLIPYVFEEWIIELDTHVHDAEG